MTGPTTVVLSAVALLPHLVLEAAAYVLLALAAIFSSQAMASYDWRDARLRSVLRASLALTVLAVATLVTAVVAEAWLVPYWLASF